MERLPGLFAFHQPSGRMDEYITMAVQQTGTVRRDSFKGRPHRVIPAVLVQEQVLHNNLGRTFLAASAITDEWAEAANMAPAITDHPSERGRPVRARNNRAVLDTMGVGFLDRARVENGKLKAEVWLDEARADQVPDLSVILGKLDEGETVELSTGFPVEVERTSGAHNGREFDVVIRPIGFDHLAVFARKRGACSVRDGCGLGVNHAGPCRPDAEGEPLTAPTQEATSMAEAPESTTAPDEVAENVASRLWERIKAALTANADSTNPAAPEATTEPADEPGSTTHPEEGTTMNRDTMIAQLADKGPLDKEALNKLSDCQLKALMGANEEPPPAAPVDGDSEAWRIAHEYRRKYEELEEQTANARESEEKERARLLDDLLYNARSLPWSEDEIKAKDIKELRKVHNAVFPRAVDFSGRGGPRPTAVSSGFDWVKPIIGGAPGESILDRGEVN